MHTTDAVATIARRRPGDARESSTKRSLLHVSRSIEALAGDWAT